VTATGGAAEDLSGEQPGSDNLKNSENARKRVESKATPKKSAGYVRPTEPEKDQRTVFVGNVALTVDKKVLN